MTSRRASALTATLLFAASAAVTLWQNAHVAVLWDLSYLLDSSFRFSLGQLPYRDIPFAHAPLTFLTQAAIIRLTGRVYWHHIAYAALANGTATVLTWRILLHQLRTRLPYPGVLAILLAAPITVLGIYSIYPHPIYDSDCILAVLFAILLLQRTYPNHRETTAPTAFKAGAPSITRTWRHGWGVAKTVLTGAALILPLFIKQNIGLLLLAVTLTAIVAIAITHRLHHQPIRREVLILLGALVTLAAALVAIHLTAGLHNYLYWTITFAAQRRLPGLSTLTGIYHQTSLLWTVPAAVAALILLRLRPTQRWSRLTALLLLAAPFLYTLAATPFLDDPSDRTDQLLSLWPHLLLLAAVLALRNLRRRPTFATLLPLILLATIHGTFLSQQLWGSTYALWPLLAILIAAMLASFPQAKLTLPLTAIISLTLLTCGGTYALTHDRLSYAQFSGTPARSTLPALRGLTTPGPWLPAFDELVAVTHRDIPASDTILLFPGQDPFYYATGRTPRFNVLLFDPATNPYSPAQLAQQVDLQHVRWLILPRTLQLTAPPLDNYDAYLAAVQPLFTPVRTVTNYMVYRRR
jgi:Ca2+/Na+ antiporter